jgi:hypothetical protein
MAAGKPQQFGCGLGAGLFGNTGAAKDVGCLRAALCLCE